MKYKKQMGALLAAVMLFQSTAVFASGTGAETESGPVTAVQSMEVSPEGQLTLEDIQRMNNGSARICKTKEGSVYFIEGTCSESPVRNMEDAKRVADSVTGILGGDSRMQFEPWRTLNDTAGNFYYVFQQMYADTTVSGGAIKIVTDADGQMTGLVSSVEPELPDEETFEGISAEEAEEIVREHEKEARNDKEKEAVEIIEGKTSKIILPVNLELDPEFDEVEESRFVWVIYTDNPLSQAENGADLPYLAHYVTMDGKYLYNMPTVIPGDEAGSAGYGASYIFEFMEPVDYTGTVELSDGTQKEITVTLMRDKRTGMYYLGNIERKIVVADCYEFLYNQGSVLVEASPDNSGWDSTCLLALYNYCRAWDYYNEIGWKGGDGLETPMIILKDFCDKDHKPVDNAAYAGRYYGWQVFLSSAANDFSQCLDVLAHEFTHCVTGTVMTYNSYLNDYGAINEAMSDIQGNICEMMYGDTQDSEWNMGENGSLGSIRSMSDPHASSQPEYSWDLYYVPKVKDPTAINDQGGVHMNSSLLNNVAYRLCNDGKMSLEEARSFWFAVDCTMVPGTDYAQLSELLPFVLRNLGMEQYDKALETAISATRLASDEMPSDLEKGQSLVTMNLPDTEQFNDGNWALFILSINPQEFSQRAMDLLEGKGDYTTAVEELVNILMEGAEEMISGGSAEETEAEVSEETETGYSAETEAETEPENQEPDLMEKLKEWFQKYFSKLAYFGNGVAGEDGTTVRMVCKPGYTIPVLIRMEMSQDSMIPKTAGLAAYMFGRWIDLGAVAGEIEKMEDPDAFLETLDDDFDPEKVFNLLSQFTGSLFYEIKEGETCEIPSDGLENIEILDSSIIEKIAAEMDAAQEEAADGDAIQEETTEKTA